MIWWASPLLALLLIVTPAAAQTYRWVDDKGVVHYTQGRDSVPERFRRGAAFPPEQRAAVLEALRALKRLQPFAVSGISLSEYATRLQRMNAVVGVSLRVIDAGPVQIALTGAHREYNAAYRVMQSMHVWPSTVRSLLVPIADTCPPVARLLLERLLAERSLSEAREFTRDALSAVFGCAASSIAEAEYALGAASEERGGPSR